MSGIKMTLRQILSTSSVILKKLVGGLVISSFKSQHESCRLILWMFMFINVYCSIWVPKYHLQIITTNNKITRERHDFPFFRDVIFNDNSYYILQNSCLYVTM